MAAVEHELDAAIKRGDARGVRRVLNAHHTLRERALETANCLPVLVQVLCGAPLQWHLLLHASSINEHLVALLEWQCSDDRNECGNDQKSCLPLEWLDASLVAVSVILTGHREGCERALQAAVNGAVSNLGDECNFATMRITERIDLVDRYVQQIEWKDVQSGWSRWLNLVRSRLNFEQLANINVFPSTNTTTHSYLFVASAFVAEMKIISANSKCGMWALDVVDWDAIVREGNATSTDRLHLDAIISRIVCGLYLEALVAKRRIKIRHAKYCLCVSSFVAEMGGYCLVRVCKKIASLEQIAQAAILCWNRSQRPFSRAPPLFTGILASSCCIFSLALTSGHSMMPVIPILTLLKALYDDDLATSLILDAMKVLASADFTAFVNLIEHESDTARNIYYSSLMQLSPSSYLRTLCCDSPCMTFPLNHPNLKHGNRPVRLRIGKHCIAESLARDDGIDVFANEVIIRGIAPLCFVDYMEAPHICRVLAMLRSGDLVEHVYISGILCFVTKHGRERCQDNQSLIERLNRKLASSQLSITALTGWMTAFLLACILLYDRSIMEMGVDACANLLDLLHDIDDRRDGLLAAVKHRTLTEPIAVIDALRSAFVAMRRDDLRSALLALRVPSDVAGVAGGRNDRSYEFEKTLQSITVMNESPLLISCICRRQDIGKPMLTRFVSWWLVAGDDILERRRNLLRRGILRPMPAGLYRSLDSLNCSQQSSVISRHLNDSAFSLIQFESDVSSFFECPAMIGCESPVPDTVHFLERFVEVWHRCGDAKNQAKSLDAVAMYRSYFCEHTFTSIKAENEDKNRALQIIRSKLEEHFK